MNNEHDPLLVFVGFPQKDDNIPRATRHLMNLFQGTIGPFRFIPFEVQTFSTAKARNIIIAEARKTNAGKILMIDADMNAGEAQVLRILNRPELIIGGCYPKKELANEPSWVGNFDDIANAEGIAPGAPGGGFLKIERAAVERLVGVADRYLSDDATTRGEEQFAFFKESVIDDDWGLTGRWPRNVGEDFYFSWLAKRAGIPTFIDTVCQVGHIGLIDYLQVYAAIERAYKRGFEDGGIN